MTTTTNDDIAAMAIKPVDEGPLDTTCCAPPQRGGSQIAVPRPSAEAALIIMDRSAERPSGAAYRLDPRGLGLSALSGVFESVVGTNVGLLSDMVFSEWFALMIELTPVWLMCGLLSSHWHWFGSSPPLRCQLPLRPPSPAFQFLASVALRRPGVLYRCAVTV